MFYMIIDADLISFDFMTDFNGPKRHYPSPYYPSGIYDGEKTIYKGPESTKYPNLILPCNIYDNHGDQISHGYYMAALSEDMKYIELYQSNELKAKIKVVKLVEKMYTKEELEEENEIIGRLKTAQMNKKLAKYHKAEEDLIAFKERAAAESFAEILDSGKGYYIIKYKHNGKYATGIIQK